MPEVDLSTRSRPELRALLDTARKRGQANASYQILQEMAERREGRQSVPPRVVSLEFGDPLGADRDADAEIAAPTAEPPDAPLYMAPPPAARRPRRRKAAGPPLELPPEAAPNVWEETPEAPPLKLERMPHPGRPGFARAALFAAGIMLGAGAGWSAATLDLSRRAPPPAATAPPANLLQIANQALPARPVAPAAAAPAQIEVVEAPAPGDPVAAGFREAPLPPPEEEVAAETPPEPAPEAPVHVAAQAAPEPPKITVPPKAPVLQKASDSACAAERTPADRTICADPQLRRLQRELRAAYGEALQVHEDRDLLRQRQLAWRDARNTVEDPDRLADLYAARIRKLHAAAEAAREGH
jgi:hypothetical protein